MVFLFGMPGGLEWVLIFAAVLLLFGGRKIPELMRGIGKGVKEFKDAKDKVKSEMEKGMNEEDKEKEVKKIEKKEEQTENDSKDKEEQSN